MATTAGTFTIVEEHSVAEIDARSSLGPIHWEAHGLQGTVDIQADGQSRLVGGHVQLELDRLKSGNALYDSELLRRVDARRYPTIVGELEEVAVDTGGPDLFRLGGTITFHGVSRPVRGVVSVDLDGDDRVTVKGSHRFDIRDYGLTPPRLLGMRFEPEFAVVLNVEATR